MNYQERFENIKGGKAGLALNLLEGSTIRDANDQAEAYITVSSSPVLKMLSRTTYIGTLEHSSSFKIYQVEESVLSRSGYLMIEFTPCIGDVEYKLIDNPNQPNRVTEITGNLAGAKSQKLGRFY